MLYILLEPHTVNFEISNYKLSGVHIALSPSFMYRLMMATFSGQSCSCLLTSKNICCVYRLFYWFYYTVWYVSFETDCSMCICNLECPTWQIFHVELHKKYDI